MSVTMDTEKQEVFTLFVVAVVGIQNFADLIHDGSWLHAAGGVHTPGETERAGFPVFSIFPFIFLLIPRYMATGGRKERCKKGKWKKEKKGGKERKKQNKQKDWSGRGRWCGKIILRYVKTFLYNMNHDIID